MKAKLKILPAIALVAVCGCFTVSETPYPETALTSLPAKSELAVRLAGFQATVVSYIPVYGRESVIVHGVGYGRRHYHPYGYTSTVLSETYVPQVNNTTVFLDRATDAFERCGFNLRTTNSTYQVEVKFEGPFTENSDDWARAAWLLFSVFTADRGCQCWSAKLKIHDSATGKLVHSRDFVHKYESLVWGPIPIFSPMGSDKAEFNFMQSRCLTALTDLAVADATAFLATKAKAK